MITLLVGMAILISAFSGFAFGILGRLALWIAADSRVSYTCKYKPLDDDNAQFETGCGKEFFNAADDGDYVTTWLSYCPYCGGKAKQEKKRGKQ
jgi:hypothetical protein